MDDKKPLVDTRLAPGREDGGWGMQPPQIIFFTGGDKWEGPNVKIENNSTKALRIVIYDCTEEWRESCAREAEEAERKKLAELKAKYESGS
jgi:hypothetical protein